MVRTFRFDSFDVDPATRHLLKAGSRLQLRDQAFQVLVMLLEHAGHVVTREQLRERLWPGDVFVDFETGLNTAVGRLRQALSDSADHPRYIETLPRVGYRFVARVTEHWVTDTTGARSANSRLVVLPFVNSSGDPSQEYFSDAFTDEITTELAALGAGIGVIARTTAMHYKGSDKPVASIAQELRVDWVVEGSVRCTDDRLVLTAQLVRQPTRCTCSRGDTKRTCRRYSACNVRSLERSASRSGPYRLPPSRLPRR